MLPDWEKSGFNLNDKNQLASALVLRYNFLKLVFEVFGTFSTDQK